MILPLPRISRLRQVFEARLPFLPRKRKQMNSLDRLARFAKKPAREKLTAVQRRLRLASMQRKLRAASSPAFWRAEYHFLRAGLRLVFHGLTPGDDLVCTAIFKELRIRHWNQAGPMISIQVSAPVRGCSSHY
jgi:hypothetical protein